MKAELVAFGSIEIDGRRDDPDVVIDQVRYASGSRNLSKPSRVRYVTPRCRPTWRFPGTAAVDRPYLGAYGSILQVAC
jgi:hypothetical protein